MYIHRYLSSVALLVILVVSVISVGCSNEANREYRELMELGEASQAAGRVYEAAKAFLSASKMQGFSANAERNLNAAVQAFDRTRSSLNEEEYESLLAEFKEWLASQPAASTERYLFIDTGNLAAKDMRAEVIQSLRQKIGAATWEEELLIELKIAGVKVESIEISTMTLRRGPSYRTMNIYVQEKYGGTYMTDQQQQAVRNVLVEAYRRPPVPPSVDLVQYLRSHPDEGVVFVPIVRFRDAE